MYLKSGLVFKIQAEICCINFDNTFCIALTKKENLLIS